MRAIQRGRREICVALVLVSSLFVMLAGGAAAATLVSQEDYRLPAGEVLEDNLYVAGESIIIDGTIDGDLVAAGGYIEVNGEISGDLLAAGGAIVVNGPVAGDVRIAGGGLTLNGPIGGDLVSASGGAALPGMPSIPMDVDGRQVQQGTHLAISGSVGKDAILAGGSGVIDGAIAGTLWAGMGSVQLNGEVGGDAHLYGNQIAVSAAASVGGVLYYSTDAESAVTIPSGVALSIEPVITEEPEAAPEPSLSEQILHWTIRLVRALVGLLVLGWLLVRLLPGFTARTVAAMNTQPLLAIGIGVLIVVAAVPAILALAGLAWLFWGFFPGALATAMVLFGVLGVLWFLSPLFTGLWVGSRLVGGRGSELLQVVLGVLLVLLLVRVAEWIPVVGGFMAWLLLLLSFSYAGGAIVLALRARASTGEPAMQAEPQR